MKTIAFVALALCTASACCLAAEGNGQERLPAATAPLFVVSQPYQNPSTSYPVLNGTFIFGSPSLNVGNGYHEATGTFTAPATGYYSFSYMINALVGPGRNVNDVAFAVDGSALPESIVAPTAALLWTDNQWTDSSNTVILRVKKGHKVSLVRPCCNSEMPYAWRGNFTGHFLHD